MIYFIVGLAGICGALLRYGIGSYVVESGVISIWATLPINVAGCLILGAFTAYHTQINLKLHPWIKAGFGTGFVGSFTTFSTFSVESYKLLQAHSYGVAACYVLLSLWGGLGGAWLGWKALLYLTTPVHRGGGESI
jgi:fluoride exporter